MDPYKAHRHGLYANHNVVVFIMHGKIKLINIDTNIKKVIDRV